jgi:hypothetical protein
MITFTIEQLLAMFSTPFGPGHMSPIQRLFSCELTLPAWKALRHTAAACEQELAAFNKKRDEIRNKYEGIVTPNGQGINFPNEEKARAFAAEWGEVMRCEVSVVGDPIRVDDVRNGFLAPNDYRCLKPFFAD